MTRRLFGRGGKRLGMLGGVVALAVTGGFATAVQAAADDDPYSFEVHGSTLKPGEGFAELAPDSVGGTPNGTLIYALSTKPLTDATWAGGGLPAGMKATVDSDCKAFSGVKGVYTCPTNDDHIFPGPMVEAAASTADETTLHYGVVYAKSGANIAAAVKQAQTVGSVTEDETRAARTVRVLTAAHVAGNTMTLSTPALAAGGTVTHTVSLHAVDNGELQLTFRPADGMRDPEEDELKVTITDAAGGPTAECDHTTGDLAYGGVTCQVTPGDATVTYTLKAGATAAAWKLDMDAVYQVYNWGDGNPEASSAFAIDSTRPVPTHYKLLARNSKGYLDYHYGTGKATAPFRDFNETIGSGWNTYTALTKLAPITVQDTGGGIVGRDATGTLWNYRMSGDWNVVKPRVKVGTGWNAYDTLTGLGDVSGDGKPDMFARDKTGVFWFYQGTGQDAAPFAPRVRVGSGWSAYTQITGVGDISGDGKADLIARDKAGVLWVYQGTGTVGAVPYAPRVKVGSGWNAYGQVSYPGDLTDDGKADLVAKDASGVLWLYKGTGNAAAPYAARVKIGSGWGAYNSLL
ncbi:VCBS repeat-containing protein [Streptomyces sp. NPDC050738]|uniref:FG-GAP repeat domain-containing protein n=1 Tax=Streptomyces sp. NPDC050738 TaxID=3154744 RepID=UPI00343A5DF2